MSKNISRAAVVRLIHDVWIAIDLEVNSSRNLSHRTDRTEAQNRMAYGMQDRWRQLNSECLRHEREHRAFGRGLHQNLRGRVSVEIAAHYFAAIAVMREVPAISTWREASEIRSDWAIGFALGEAFAALDLWPSVRESLGPEGADKLTAMHAIDYAKDLV
jgi:hypothetical protein